jgi:2-keto-4-pentenoate hydratase
VPVDVEHIACLLTDPTAERVAIQASSAGSDGFDLASAIRADLAGPKVTSSHVPAAMQLVAVGVEILDSRYTDYTFTTGDVVADNTSADSFVVRPAIPAAGLDLRLIGVLLEHNGEAVGAPLTTGDVVVATADRIGGVEVACE